MVVADGVRRPVHGGPLLRRAGSPLSGRGFGLQLVEEDRQSASGLARRLDDADRLHRVDRGGRAGLPADAASDLRRVPDRRGRHR